MSVENKWLYQKKNHNPVYIIEESKPLFIKRRVIFLSNKANALAHTKWMCKYHIVFTPKLSIEEKLYIINIEKI